MTSLILSTPSNPISWFELFILSNDLEMLLPDFKKEAKDKGGYFMYEHPYTGLNDYSTYFIDIEENGEMNSIGFSFNRFIAKKIEYEYGLCIINIKKGLLQNRNDSQKNEFIVSIDSKLDSLMEIAAHSATFKNHNELLNYLNLIKKYLSSQVNLAIHNITDPEAKSNPLRYTGDNNKIDFLFNTLIDIGIFDEDEGQQEIFKKLLNGSKIHSKQKLRVISTIGEVAYTFQKLSKLDLFYNIKPAAIQKTSVFINKKGKSITANDLSKALTNFLKKPKNPDKTKIDKIIKGFANHIR